MSEANLALARFEPETIIEITDVMRGFRKLGVVTPSGDAYFDLSESEEDATPFPIYEALDPQAAGEELAWSFTLADNSPENAAKFNELMETLLALNLDTITYYRAVKWACDARNFDPDQALAAGRQATDAVRESRAFMDRLIAEADVPTFA